MRIEATNKNVRGAKLGPLPNLLEIVKNVRYLLPHGIIEFGHFLGEQLK